MASSFRLINSKSELKPEFKFVEFENNQVGIYRSLFKQLTKNKNYSRFQR